MVTSVKQTCINANTRQRSTVRSVPRLSQTRMGANSDNEEPCASPPLFTDMHTHTNTHRTFSPLNKMYVIAPLWPAQEEREKVVKLQILFAVFSMWAHECHAKSTSTTHMPSCPYIPEPHAYSFPSSVIATACPPPSATAILEKKMEEQKCGSCHRKLTALLLQLQEFS